MLIMAACLLSVPVWAADAFPPPPAPQAGTYPGATQGFAQVFGIPQGYHNACIRTPQQTYCPGRLTLDLQHCGVDPNGRKYCLNKCVIPGR